MPITLLAQNFTIKPTNGALDSRTPTGAVANRAPVWQASVPDQNILAGSVGSTYANYVTDPDSDAMTFGRETPAGQAADTAPAGIMITSAGVPVVASGVPASNPLSPYTVWVYADDGRSNAVDDWVSRSNAPGVIWANRFGDATSDYWIQANTQGGGAVARRLTTDGIIGDGCFEIAVPAGSTPGNCQWMRPLAPVTAAVPQGSFPAYPADVNKAGKTAIDFQTFYSVTPGQLAGKAYNMRGGMFGNAAYYDTTQVVTGVPEFVHSGTFWLQYRIKISANKLRSDEKGGKLMILGTNPTGTAMQEYVHTIWGSDRAATYNMLRQYTAQGNRGISELTNPQGGNAGAEVQPNSPQYPACVYADGSGNITNYINNCWVFPPDTWVTMMIGITPGRQSITADGGYTFTTKYLDAGVVVKVALPGATSWTTLCNKQDFYWWYDADLGSIWGGKQPFGFNFLNFTLYNGGTNQVAATRDYNVRWDQVICSTTEIALPAV